MSNRTPKKSTLGCPTIVGRSYMKGGFISSALSCAPWQAGDHQERVNKAGCTGLQFDKKGRCHVSNRPDYDAHSKSIGLCEEPTGPIAPD